MKTQLPIRAGVFDDKPHADHAVDELLAAGFDRSSISVVSKDAEEQEPTDPKVKAVARSGAHTRGAIAGGATLGALTAGLTAGLLMSPTQGEVLYVAGPVLAALFGGVVGGYIGAMMTRGFEPAIADFHDQALEKSQYLVAVKEREDDPPLSKAASVLEHSGAAPLPLRKD
jgi:surface antigen